MVKPAYRFLGSLGVILIFFALVSTEVYNEFEIDSENKTESKIFIREKKFKDIFAGLDSLAELFAEELTTEENTLVETNQTPEKFNNESIIDFSNSSNVSESSPDNIIDLLSDDTKHSVFNQNLENATQSQPEIYQKSDQDLIFDSTNEKVEIMNTTNVNDSNLVFENQDQNNSELSYNSTSSDDFDVSIDMANITNPVESISTFSSKNKIEDFANNLALNNKTFFDQPTMVNIVYSDESNVTLLPENQIKDLVNNSVLNTGNISDILTVDLKITHSTELNVTNLPEESNNFVTNKIEQLSTNSNLEEVEVEIEDTLISNKTFTNIAESNQTKEDKIEELNHNETTLHDFGFKIENFTTLPVEIFTPSKEPILKKKEMIEVEFESFSKSLNVSQGKAFELKCLARSDLNSQLHSIIYKDGVFVAESNTSSIRIKFENIQISNQGVYSCFVFTQDRQVFNSTSLQINVLTKRFNLRVEPNKKFLIVKEGEPLSIACDLDSNIESEIYLYKNNELISHSNWSVEIDKKRASKSDEGSYVCHAYAQDKSIFKFEKIDVLIDTKTEVLGFENEKLILSCSLRDQFSTLSWIKIDGELGPNVALENNDLVFTNLKLDDSGEYQCSGNNLEFERIKLNVKSSEKPKAFDLRTYLLDDQIQAKIGQTVRQVCTSLTNGDNLKISWNSPNAQRIRSNGRISIRTSVTSHTPLGMVSILTINDFRESDYGIYECRPDVSQQVEPSKFKIIPDLKSQMSISYSDKVKKLKLNESFEFDCSISFNRSEDVRMTLYKDDIIVKTSKSGMIKYRIEKAKQSDEGLYLCQAYSQTDSRSNFESKSLNIEIENPKELLIAEGSNFTLSCNLDSNGAPISWEKTNGSLRTKVESSNGRLKFKNFKHSDIGEYVCSIDDKSEKIELTLVESRGIETRTYLKAKTISKKPGNMFEQACTAMTNGFTSPENLKIEWFDTNGKILKNESQFEIHEYVSNMSPLIKVSLLNFKYIDNKDYGSYECRVSYGHLINTIDFNLVDPFGTRTKIIPRINTELIEIYLGDDLNLECQTDEPVTKQWFINNKNATRNKNVQINESFLEIKNASLDLNGFISCRVVSNDVISQVSVKLVVKDQQRGTTAKEEFSTTRITSTLAVEKLTQWDNFVISNNSDLQIDSGANIQIYCLTNNLEDGNQTNFLWTRKNKIKLAHNVNRDNNVLRILNFNEENEGVYECAYDEEKTIDLKLTVKKPITAFLPIERIELRTSENYTIECETTGNPKPSIIWLFKNTEINNNEQFTVNENLLHINNPNEELNGEIVCKAVGSNGSFAEDSTEVVFIGRKKITISIHPKELNFTIENNATFRCDISDSIPENEQIKYIWFKNGHELDKYTEHEITIKPGKNENVSCRVESKNFCSDTETAVLNLLEAIYVTSNKVFDLNQKLSVKQFENVTLNCHSDIYKDAIFSWEFTHRSNTITKHFNGSEIILTNSQIDDSGTYECSISDPYSLEEFITYTVDILVFVYEPLSVKLEAKFEGGIVLFECIVTQGLPVPTILNLTKDERSIEDYITLESTQMQNILIRINKTKIESSGLYKCYAENDFDAVQDYYYLGSDGFNYENTTVDKSKQEVILNDITTVENITHFEAIFVEKNRNESILNNTSLISTFNENTTNADGSFKNETISEPVFETTLEDLLENKTINVEEKTTLKETISSNTTIINEIKTNVITTKIYTTAEPTTSTTTVFAPIIANWSVNVNSSVSYEFYTGSNIEFICNSYTFTNKDDLVYKWQTVYPSQMPTNFKIDNNILKIENLDDTNVGMYKCEIKNNKENKFESVIINLEVKKKPEPPTANIVNRIINLDSQRRTTVTCLTTGYPKPKIIWFFNGEEVKTYPYYFYELNNLLLIRNPSHLLNGYITCQATGYLNQKSESTSLLVHGALILPKVDISLSKNNATIGTNVEFNCIILNEKNLKIKNFYYDWFKNGQLISENNVNSTLILKVNSSENSGIYSCQAKDKYLIVKSNIADVNFEVFEKLELKINIASNHLILDKHINIKQTDILTLNCLVKVPKNNFAKTKWLLDSAEAYESVEISQNVFDLKIFNVQIKHSGKYWCAAESNDTKLEPVNDYVIVTVEEYQPIDVEIQPISNDDETIVYACLFDGIPTPTAKWIRVDNDTDVGRQEVDDWAVKLYLNKTENNDAVVYECIAENKFETKLDRIAIQIGVNVNEPVSFPIRLETTQKVELNEEVTTLPEVHNPEEITKEFLNLETTVFATQMNITSSSTSSTTTITESISTSTITTTTSSSSTSTTTTTTTTLSTETSTSTTTTVSTITTTTTSTTTTTTTTTTIPTTTKKITIINKVKKDVISKSKIMFLEIGSDIDIECSLFKDKNSIASIQWFRLDNQDLSTKINRKKNVLKIRNFDFLDIGNYLCTGITFNESKSLNLTLKTKEQFKVQVKLKKVFYEFNNGQRFHITCNTYPHFTSNNTLIKEIQWSINEKRAESFPNLKVNDDRLYILNGTDDLHGLVSCKAILNNGQFAEDTAVIRMNKRKSLLADIFPKMQNLTIGDQLEISCILEELKDNGDLSEVEYEWRKDGKLLLGYENIKFDNKKKSLKINISSVEDAGYYTCQAYDENLKSNIVKARLDVYEIKKTTIEIKSNKRIINKQIYVRQSDNVTLECQVKSNEQFIPINWYKVDGNLDWDYITRSNDGRSLHITNIQPSHWGKYSCQAHQNDAKSEPQNEFIDIFIERYEPINLNINLIDSFDHHIIKCNVQTGYPVPELVWYRDNNFVTEYKTINSNGSSEVYLKKSDLNIFGVYECRASNRYDSVNTTYKLENVPKNQDDFSVDITEDLIHLNAGDSYEIKCNLKGFRTNQVEWYHNNTLIGLRKKSNFKISDNILKISKASEEDNGEIKCLAFEYPINKSDIVKLQVVQTKIQEFNVEIEPREFEAYESDNVTFKCNIIDEKFNSNTKLKYYWLKGEKILEENFENELTLANVNLDSSGDYYCKIESMLSNRISNLAKATLKIKTVPMTIIKQGLNAEIVCKLSHTNDTIFAWRKIGGELDPKRHVQNVDKLQILEIKIEDRGDYECTTKTDNDLNIEYIRVEVEPREAPILTLYPSQEVIDQYGRFPSVQCKIEAGIPEPTITWRRYDGEKMSSRVKINNHILNIKDTQPEDYGLYECVAENEAGIAVEKFIIRPPVRY
ncbi:unnamed protein product [Brachionus calyciflorus]|uniref:Ig-like domain-containing protein n=1 Tax=Brachionus calyciflorus TaxID=104777 RepID=A0A813MBY2_9BILA|nr:unnamed protein product [Brachionus calyciflorus]